MKFNIHPSTAMRACTALQDVFGCAYPHDANTARLNALAVTNTFFADDLTRLLAWGANLDWHIGDILAKEEFDVGAQVYGGDMHDQLKTTDRRVCDVVAGLAGLITARSDDYYCTPEVVKRYLMINIDDFHHDAQIYQFKTL